MAYKVKGDEVSIKGFAQPFSGEVSDELYKLIVKKNPAAKSLFEKAEGVKEESAPVKSDD